MRLKSRVVDGVDESRDGPASPLSPISPTSRCDAGQRLANWREPCNSRVCRLWTLDSRASCSRPVPVCTSHPTSTPPAPRLSQRQRVEMESLGPLISWARTRGVELDGIAPQQMPGRGIGAVATRSIKVPSAHTVKPPSAAV